MWGDWESQWRGGGADTDLAEKVRFEQMLKKVRDGGMRVFGEGAQQQKQARGAETEWARTEILGKCNFCLLFVHVWFVHPHVFKTPTPPRNEMPPSIQCATLPFLSTTYFKNVFF